MEKLIGECLSLVSSSIEIYERNSKTYKKSIKIGVIRYCIQALSYLLLGGINGVIITLMAIVRHILMFYKKFTWKIVAVWLFVSITINLYYANSLIDLYPLVATIQFTLMARKQNTLSLKYAQVVNTLIWSVYHIFHKTYVYFIFDIILLLVGIIRIKRGVED